MTSNSTPEVMSAEDMREATTLILQISGKRKSGDMEGAYRVVRTGASLYPGLTVDGIDVWRALKTEILPLLNGEAMLALLADGPVSGAPAGAAVAPVSVAPVSVAPVSVAPVSVAPVSVAPVSVAPVDPTLVPGEGPTLSGKPSHGIITITHTNQGGTVLTGSQPHDGAMDVLGAGGQRWNLSRKSPRFFYLGKSSGWAADMERIGYAALALRRAGWDVVYNISNKVEYATHDAPAKKPSASRTNRHMECERAARRQQWVDSKALLAAAPVSGAPVSGAPVSGAPVSGAPVSGAPVSGAPVSGAPAVRVPRPPVQAQSVITTPDYANVSDDLLLAAMLTGDVGAATEVRNRMRRNASELTGGDLIMMDDEAHAYRKASTTAAAPVAAPAAPAAVSIPNHVVIDGLTAEMWFDASVSGRAMADAATELRGKLNRSVAHRFGEKGDRPKPQVFRSKSNRAFRVTVAAPVGTDMETLVAEVIKSAQTLKGVGEVREPVLGMASADA